MVSIGPTRTNPDPLVFCLAGTLLFCSPTGASAGSGDLFQITATDGRLVGEGYQSGRMEPEFGAASVLVRDQDDTGLVTGRVRADGHTYTVLMTRFGGEEPFMSGGIARDLPLRAVMRPFGRSATSGRALVAGRGSGCSVWKDSDLLGDDYRCRFAVAESQGTLTLHLVAFHPDEGSAAPDRIHFVWNDVQWWDGPVGLAPAGDRRERLTDRALQRLIERELDLSPVVDATDIEVTVSDRHVTLSGTADSALQRAHAYFAAWVQGVASVRNEIDVPEDGPRRDHELRAEILQAYGINPLIGASRPRVAVREGVVTLRGTVGSREARWAAEDVARHMPGVEAVVNRLEVRRLEEAD